MKVLVLGATGSVGRLVVEEALRRGHGVTVLVRRTERLGAVASRVIVAQGDDALFGIDEDFAQGDD